MGKSNSRQKGIRCFRRKDGFGSMLCTHVQCDGVAVITLKDGSRYQMVPSPGIAYFEGLVSKGEWEEVFLRVRKGGVDDEDSRARHGDKDRVGGDRKW